MLHTAAVEPSQSVAPAPAAVLDVYSHNVTVTGHDNYVRSLLVEFCRRQALMGPHRVGPGRYEQVMKKIFASATRTRDEFRFHRNQLDSLISFLSYYGVKRELLKRIEHPPYVAPDIEFTLADKRPPREKQVSQINYLCQPPMEGYAPSKVVELQTGGGKGYVAFKALEFHHKRAAIIVPAKFLKKWEIETKEVTGFPTEEIVTVRGSGDLKSIINLAIEGAQLPKVLLISSDTFINYIDAYNDQMIPEYGGYGLHPIEFYEKLGIGVRVIDEVHLNFHRNFKFDLFSHIPLTISLSATLDADQRFMNERYRIVWPLDTRPPEVEYDAFIDVHSVFYSINRPELIRCTGFAKMYNHPKFEESIMKNKFMLGNYLEMILSLVEDIYIKVREPGQKMFVFCATVNMCTLIAEKIRLNHPELHVERYVSEDDFEKNCLTPDVVVSTVGSAGTGVDVPNLRETLNTVALDSKQSSLQVLGRTRRLKDWPDVTPGYWMLYAREIPKHVQYCRAKDEKFKGKIKSSRIVETRFKI